MQQNNSIAPKYGGRRVMSAFTTTQPWSRAVVLGYEQHWDEIRCIRDRMTVFLGIRRTIALI